MLENYRHNVSNLPRNNVNITLANYVIKLLKSIYLYPILLVVGLYQTHWNDFTELVSNTLVSITSVPLDLRLEVTSGLRYKNRVRITSENYISSMLEISVIKPSKWSQKVT